MALNIFEPRYRLMVRRCMEGNRRFGMAVMEHSHALHGVACEAEIVECQPQPDGYATHLWPTFSAQHLPHGAKAKGRPSADRRSSTARRRQASWASASSAGHKAGPQGGTFGWGVLPSDPEPLSMRSHPMLSRKGLSGCG